MTEVSNETREPETFDEAGSILRGIARRDASRAPMDLLEEADVQPASGVAADFRGKPGKRQVTVIGLEAWIEACAEIGKALPWTTRRANLLLVGVDLRDSIGARLEIGEVVLEITGETRPCGRMDEAHEGLREALLPDWRAGATCRLLSAGHIRIGDPIRLLPPE
jgi:MOSC domain-containing protein YiiM